MWFHQTKNAYPKGKDADMVGKVGSYGFRFPRTPAYALASAGNMNVTEWYHMG